MIRHLAVVAALGSCAPAECAPTTPTPAPVLESAVTSLYGTAVWDRIARCESGGNWNHGPVTNSSGTYSGGLMIGHRWWPAYGGREFAAYPYQASKAQQITVAERIADDVGLDRGWQCFP